MIFRSLLLLLPLGLRAWFIIHPHWTSRDIAATFLGFVWSFHVSLILNIIFISAKVFSFSAKENLFYGVPLDWIISQSIIMGALVPLAQIWGWSIVFRIFLQSILITLIYYFGNVAANEMTLLWVVMLVTALAAIPAMFLSDWTRTDHQIVKRSMLQSFAWAIFLFWFFPSIIFHLTVDNWSGLLQRDNLIIGLYLVPLLIPAYILINALYHFAVHGDGTAFPYDPPKRLVTQGIYRYISNPMQVGISLAMGWWGIIIQSMWVSVSAVIAIILFVVFRDICNGSCAIGLNNPEWEEYQRMVPKWWPRFRRLGVREHLDHKRR